MQILTNSESQVSHRILFIHVQLYMVPVVKCTRCLHCGTREGERETETETEKERERERDGGREGEGDMQMFTNSE